MRPKRNNIKEMQPSLLSPYIAENSQEWMLFTKKLPKAKKKSPVLCKAKAKAKDLKANKA